MQGESMNKHNDIEVIINNRRYMLSGYESEEYLQKIASYINNKHNEYKNKESYKFLDADLRSILIQINIADDFFKARDQISELNVEGESKSNELFDLKHEIISLQTKNNDLHKEINELKAELNDYQKKLVRMEAELNEAQKNRPILG